MSSAKIPSSTMPTESLGYTSYLRYDNLLHEAAAWPARTNDILMDRLERQLR